MTATASTVPAASPDAPVTTIASSVLDHSDPTVRSAMRARVAVLMSTLGGPGDSSATTEQLLAALDSSVDVPTGRSIWLMHAVLSARLPDQESIETSLRAARLDGTPAVVAKILAATVASQNGEPYNPVEVITDQVVVDLHHTAQALFATGIQRVARETAARWHRDHEIVPIGWTKRYASLRRLDPDQAARAFGTVAADTATSTGTDAGEAAPQAVTVAAVDASDSTTVGALAAEPVLVPWNCTYLVPELLAEPDRARAFQALVRHSGSRIGMLGFDCVPLTTAETTADGMGGAFAMMLSAAAYADRIAAISHGAAGEYRGWTQMLTGAGLPGPEIGAISLPVQARVADDQSVQLAREAFEIPGLPVILVVGSHEPRKNHLAVLHAAERLWRDGVQFSLAFVGGNAWNSDRFTERLRELQATGRPVHSVSALDDSVLWAAYRIARCTVFPSLNEGFGLPVAESLASGTPVITSNFGSMREIAEPGGALLIDPRDDRQLTDAMRAMLTDDVHQTLSAQARSLPSRSWDEYAAETWDYLLGN